MRTDKTVLVVDDDDTVRRLIFRIFHKGYEIQQAADGPEALRLLGDRRPDLVLLDVIMPTMNGLDVLQAALKASPGLQVLMLTAVTDISTAKKALDFGACAYITKPFHIKDLAAEIERRLAPADQESRAEGKYRPWRVEL